MRKGRVFRVFVSSTFKDFAGERKSLQERARAELEAFVHEKGNGKYTFEWVDLRWGISEEAQWERKTMRICLEEIRRCQQLSPRPNFVTFLGARYGYRPAPERIPKADFDSMCGALPDHVDLLRKWYRLDANFLEPCYVLRSIESLDEKVAWDCQYKTIVDGIASWAVENKPDELAYGGSATHQEILKGLFNTEDCPDARNHVFAYLRNGGAGVKAGVEAKGGGRPPAHLARRDVGSGHQELDDDYAMADLRDVVRDRLGPQAKEYILDEGRWGKAEDAEKDPELNGLCDRVIEDLKGIIGAQIEQANANDVLDEERAIHREFQQSRSEVVVGRENELALLRNACRQVSDGTGDPAPGDKRLILVTGEGGEGKSALLARLVGDIETQVGKKPRLVYRFIGLTASSADIDKLLNADCGITAELGRPATADPTAPAWIDALPPLYRPFHRALHAVDGPTVIVLDALDQLSDDGMPWLLDWLDVPLPPQVTIVASVRNGTKAAASLEPFLQPHSRIDLGGLSGDAAIESISVRLQRVGRRLSDEQLERARSALGSDARSPLLLALWEEELRLVSSSDAAVPELPQSMGDAVKRAVERLAAKENHGLLATQVLGYLAASREGLDEVLDLPGILAADSKLMEWVQTFRGHQFDFGRYGLPPIFWSRLYFDMEPYLGEVSRGRYSLLRFFHSDFQTAIYDLLVAKKMDGIDFHERLQDYYWRALGRAELDQGKSDSSLAEHVLCPPPKAATACERLKPDLGRALMEYSYQALHAHKPEVTERLSRLINDPDWHIAMTLADEANLARQDLAEAAGQKVANAAGWQAIWEKQQAYTLDSPSPVENQGPSVNARLLFQIAASSGMNKIKAWARSWVKQPANAPLLSALGSRHLYCPELDEAFQAQALGPTHYFRKDELELGYMLSLFEQGVLIGIRDAGDLLVITAWHWSGTLQQRKILVGKDWELHWKALKTGSGEILGQSISWLDSNTGDWIAELPDSGSMVHVKNRSTGEHREYRFPLANSVGVYRNRYLVLSNSVFGVMELKDLESDALKFKGWFHPGSPYFLPHRHQVAILQRRRFTLLDLAEHAPPVVELAHTRQIEKVILQDERVTTLGGMELIERNKDGSSRSMQFLDSIKFVRFDGHNLAVVDRSGGLTFVSLDHGRVIYAHEAFKGSMPEAKFANFVFTEPARGIAVDFYGWLWKLDFDKQTIAPAPLNASLSRRIDGRDFKIALDVSGLAVSLNDEDDTLLLWDVKKDQVVRFPLELPDSLWKLTLNPVENSVTLLDSSRRHDQTIRIDQIIPNHQLAGAGELPELLQYKTSAWRRLTTAKCDGRLLLDENDQISWFGNFEIWRSKDSPNIFSRSNDKSQKSLVAVTQENCYWLEDLLQ